MIVIQKVPPLSEDLSAMDACWGEMVREAAHAPEDCPTHITLGGLGNFKRVHDFGEE